MFQTIDKKELKDLANKNKTLVELWTQPTPSYNDYVKCLRLLNFGIMGHKYNFKNNKNRKIVITLSPDNTKLVYHDANKGGMFQSSTSVKLSKFHGITFGGAVENFKKHRRLLRSEV